MVSAGCSDLFFSYFLEKSKAVRLSYPQRAFKWQGVNEQHWWSKICVCLISWKTCRDWPLHLQGSLVNTWLLHLPGSRYSTFENYLNFEPWVNFELCELCLILRALSTLNCLNLEFVLNFMWFTLGHALCLVWRPIARETAVPNYRQI